MVAPLAWQAVRLTPLLAVALVVALGCAGSQEPVVPAQATSPLPSPTAATSDRPGWIPGLGNVPPQARAGDGGPAPRAAAYWILWNACAPDNRAPEAAANGGRAAGFVLVDDLLISPGIGLGDHRLGSCEEALAVLRGGDDTTGEPSVARLAARLLVAELNLAVGSETCPVAEEVAIGAQAVLAAAGYRGPGVQIPIPGGEVGEALPTLTSLLGFYADGSLCS